MRLASLAAVLLLAAALLLAVDGSGLYGASADLHAGSQQLRAAAATLGGDPARWTPAGIEQARAAVAEATGRIDRGRDRLESDAVLNAVAGLPGAGDQVAAARDLADADAAAARAAADLVQAAATYEAVAGASLARRLGALATLQPLVADADSRLAQAQATLERDRGQALLPPLAAEVEDALGAISEARTTLDQMSRLPGS